MTDYGPYIPLEQDEKKHKTLNFVFHPERKLSRPVRPYPSENTLVYKAVEPKTHETTLVRLLNSLQLQSIIREDVTYRMIDRLTNFLQLTEDWDGEGGYSIEPKAIDNSKFFVGSLPSQYMHKWVVFPNSNGTVLMTRNDGQISSISIGVNGFSYFGIIDNEIISDEKDEFKIPDLTQAFLRLSK